MGDKDKDFLSKEGAFAYYCEIFMKMWNYSSRIFFLLIEDMLSCNLSTIILLKKKVSVPSFYRSDRSVPFSTESQ